MYPTGVSWLNMRTASDHPIEVSFPEADADPFGFGGDPEFHAIRSSAEGEEDEPDAPVEREATVGAQAWKVSPWGVHDEPDEALHVGVQKTLPVCGASPSGGVCASILLPRAPAVVGDGTFPDGFPVRASFSSQEAVGWLVEPEWQSR